MKKPGRLPGLGTDPLSLWRFLNRRSGRFRVAIAEVEPLLHHLALIRRELPFVLIRVHEFLLLIRRHVAERVHLLTNRIPPFVRYPLHAIEQSPRLLMLLGSHV